MFYCRHTDVRAQHVLIKAQDISQNPHQLIHILSDWDTNIPGGGKAVCSDLVSSGNVTCGSVVVALSCDTQHNFFDNSEGQQCPCSWLRTVAFSQFIHVFLLLRNTWINFLTLCLTFLAVARFIAHLQLPNKLPSVSSSLIHQQIFQISHNLRN